MNFLPNKTSTVRLCWQPLFLGLHSVEVRDRLALRRISQNTVNFVRNLIHTKFVRNLVWGSFGQNSNKFVNRRVHFTQRQTRDGPKCTAKPSSLGQSRTWPHSSCHVTLHVIKSILPPTPPPPLVYYFTSQSPPKSNASTQHKTP